jgi:hypothetical protein
MVVEALATCARLNYENKQFKSLIIQLMSVQEQLVTQIEGGKVADSNEDPQDEAPSGSA